jgi:hypothetical protein
MDDKLPTDTKTIPDKVDPTDQGYFEDFIGPKYSTKTYKEQKYIALYKARYLLQKIGSMQERIICGKKLKTMKVKGLKTI